MSSLDYAILAVYFAIVLGVGFWYKRRAARGLDSYFLGDKSIHWLALAIAGASATFDITGTMWIVTLLTLFGLKSMWNHWMWGFLMAAFFMSYMGKWVRRSNVMTGAEWMITRFGDRLDGQIARWSYGLMAIAMLTGLIGYAFQGIGKFISVYLGLGPLAAWVSQTSPALAPYASWCVAHEAAILATAIFAITTLYVLFGGMYSIVVTHVIQTAVLMVAAVFIAGVAYVHLTPEVLAAVKPADGTSMTSLAPVWHLPNAAGFKDYGNYVFFGPLVVMWVAKGLLLNLGGPGQMTDFQVFLACRDARDASKLGSAWSVFLIVRWAMCMGIALLFVTGAVAVSDPEKVMPTVLRDYLPMGIRGLVIAGLLAAFMSTFSSTVNAAASYVVRDLWQPLVGRHASPKHLVRASYVATLAVVVVGIAMGLQTDSIRGIWDWIMMALGAAFIVPNVLRWYWWRLNAWGYASGTLAGLAAALVVPRVPDLSLPHVAFPLICGLSTIGCLAGTWLTRPTDEAILVSFYRSVRPFGLWGSIPSRSGLSAEELRDPRESLWLTATNVILSSTVILGAYLAPMYLVGHWHREAAAWFAAALAAAIVLYFTWYRNLPAAEPR